MPATLGKFTSGSIAKLARALVAAVAISASGCSMFQGVRSYIDYNDATNDFVLGWRNRVWARQAWHERKDQFVGEPQYVAFGDGFRSGYESVASGGNGCPPPLPPRSYWSWKYQSPEGQAKVAAWFSGFPHGARAAEEDGAGMYQQIQVSHSIEQQYSPEFYEGYMMPDGSPVPGPHIPPEFVPAPAGDSLPAAPVLDTTSREPVAAPLVPAITSAWPANTEVMREEPSRVSIIPASTPSPVAMPVSAPPAVITPAIAKPSAVTPAAFAPSNGWPGTVRISPAPPVQLQPNFPQ